MRLYMWLGGTAIAFLVLLAIVLIRPGPFPADAGSIRWIQSALGVVTDPASSIAQVLMLFAPPVAALLYLVYKRRWRVALWFLGVVVSSILVSGILQLAVSRPGPPPRTVLQPQTVGSFPSVSAEEAVVQAALIAYLGWKFAWPAVRVIIALAVADAALLSLVLIDTAVHWPSDVLGGLCFGGAWTAIALIAAKRWRRLRISEVAV